MTHPIEHHIDENAQEHWPKPVQTIKRVIRDRIEKKTYNNLTLATGIGVTSAKRAGMKNLGKRERGSEDP